ncbi:TniQ protein [Azospirillum baldaniorum]|uniref:TniQ family protein n=1 Tax=Azospirillum baldaniorum TaxID=1064539 RepID=UPI00119F996F|nr:TniQ family protein [Azospirillum baldaniorum]TWA60433.1 TniQ protein [Azospirillum baldaniorum]
MTGNGQDSPRNWSDHRLTVPRKRGILMRPLVFRPDPPPIPGESLLGLLARTADRNGFTGLMKVLSFADIGTGTSANLPSVDPNAAQRVAYILKVAEEEVTARCHPRIVRHDPSGDFVDFFGVALRALYREKARRRVSPRALAISPHHRALHDLRPFSFCPETMERLIDACPVCHKTLRWTRTKGVAYCEHCVDADDTPRVDLREHPQELVTVEDDTALRYVTDLVNPDPTKRARALRNTDWRFDGHNPGDLFEFIIRLTQALSTPPMAHYRELRRLKTIEDFCFLTPDRLARTGRALMDWKSGFQALADTMRANAGKRPGHFGATKEFGALRLLPRLKTVHSSLRHLVSKAIGDHLKDTAHELVAPRRRADLHRLDLIDATTAAERLGVNGADLAILERRKDIEVIRTRYRSLALFQAREIEDIRRVRMDMIGAVDAAHLIGLPVEALEALAHAGVIQRVTGPALALSQQTTLYRLSSVRDLMSALMNASRSGRPPNGYRRFDTALRRLPPGPKPWLDLVRAVTEGTLPVARPESTKRGLFLRLFVEEAALAAVMEVTDSPAASRDCEATLSYREAALVIGVSTPAVSWLVAAGLIATTDAHRRRITGQALTDFTAHHMLTKEIAKWLDLHPNQVKQTLARYGIEPVCALKENMRLVWRRSDVSGCNHLWSRVPSSSRVLFHCVGSERRHPNKTTK